MESECKAPKIRYLNQPSSNISSSKKGLLSSMEKTRARVMKGKVLFLTILMFWVLVAHTCNPSYSGGRDPRILVQNQPGQIVHETLSQKKKKSQKRAGRVSQGVGPEFKLQYHNKKLF
jgi:hypothetical protein